MDTLAEPCAPHTEYLLLKIIIMTDCNAVTFEALFFPLLYHLLLISSLYHTSVLNTYEANSIMFLSRNGGHITKSTHSLDKTHI